MGYKFVLWGYGRRGKRFLEICPLKHVVAVIDKNVELDGCYEGIPFISYEKYKQNYCEYDIVISATENAEIVEKLNRDRIYTYHLLQDCPPEVLGIGNRLWIDELPIGIEPRNMDVIYGLNLYSILLREFLLQKYKMDEMKIIPDLKDSEISRAFAEKYEFIDIDEQKLQYKRVLCATRRNDEIKKYQCKISDVFDFSDRISQYLNPDLLNYHNMYAEKTCFLVATGPSLKIKDLDTLKKNKCICMSVNKIYLSFDDTEWRPDIYVAIDEKVVRDSIDQIREIDISEKIVGDACEEFWDDNVLGINRIHVHLIDYCEDSPRFSEDITKCTYEGWTVLYSCFQIAVYMGFRKIYLLGVDHNYTEQAKHFHKDYYKALKNPLLYYKEKAELAFQSAKKYADAHDIKIYNATRGGKLEVFERVDFDSLFAEK